jgi:hypothetical protein
MICRESIRSDAIFPARAADVKVHADGQHDYFHTLVPATEFHKLSPRCGSSGIEQYVWPMADEIEHPVADDADPHSDGARAIVRGDMIDPRECRSPHHEQQQAV